MKKILNIKNIVLLLIVVLVAVLTLNMKEVKAAGTVTWSGPSSITIRETIHNIAGPIVASREYDLWDDSTQHQVGSTATINYTASDTITNYQITKSTTMNLSNLTFTKPGDYEYYLFASSIYDSDSIEISDYFWVAEGQPDYVVIVQVRNVVDSNNTPTGDYTASLVLKECTYNEQSDEDECTKINPVSGNLITDFVFETNPEMFGDIELSKTVKGIGADTTKYFPMTITINNDPGNPYFLDTTGWTYPITGVDATVTYNGSTVTNPTTITVGTPVTIYLKHGQTAIIGQGTKGGDTFMMIPAGRCENAGGKANTKAYDTSKKPSMKRLAIVEGLTCYGSYYTIEENPGDYTPAFTTYYNPPTSGYYLKPTGINGGVDNTVGFINTKEMSPVTGLIFTILPYVILAGIGAGGTLLIMHLKKKKANN